MTKAVNRLLRDHEMTIDLYRKYLAAREATPFSGQILPYDWGKLPNSLSFEWMPYREMFREYSSEIANSVNELTDFVHRLKAWSVVITSINDDQEMMDAVHEFIDPLGTLSLTLPYSIRSQFIYASAHLCHQANRSVLGIAWTDEFPSDDKIYFQAADKFGSTWKSYNEFKHCVERINDKKHQSETRDFRNAFSHRFSSRFVMGITQMIKRRVDPTTNDVSYTFGGSPPFHLEAVAQLLGEQCDCCYEAFGAFQKMIREHEASIAKSSL